MKLVLSLFLSLLGVTAAAGGQEPSPRVEDPEAWIEALTSGGDNADQDLIRRLANLRTAQALEGLLAAYEEMQSIYMRRAVLQGLVIYDEVAGLERKALQRIMDAATLSRERELRAIAVDLIADCRHYGKAFLAMITESAAEDEVRERALQHHIGNPRPEDFAWYREIYEGAEEAKGEKRDKKSRRDEESEARAPRPYPLQSLRVLAFEGLVLELEPDELLRALDDKNRKIRRRALEELDSRGETAAIDLAEEYYDDKTRRDSERLLGARILAAEHGAKMATRFLDDGLRGDASEEFMNGLAELLAGFNDPLAEKAILKKAGKGKGSKLIFGLRSARGVQDPRFDKTLVKLLKNKDRRVRIETLSLLGEREVDLALPDLEKFIAKTKNDDELAYALDAIGEIRGYDRAWLERLEGYAEHEDADVRNGALRALGGSGKSEYQALLILALESEDWSTRLMAAEGLERMRTREGLAALCQRIPKEGGRIAVEMGEILFRMTGRPFRNDGRLWEAWWKNSGAEFEFPQAADIRKAEREEKARRLRDVTKTTFFGIRVESHGVCFVLDTSGSMQEHTRGRYVDEKGEPRIEVAKRELSRALASLEKNSLFNVVPFDSSPHPWRETIAENSAATLAEAEGFVAELRAEGGTDLFGALQTAFGDRQVDTIYVLSDGEPSSGDVVDPWAIRSIVAQWNEHRGVVIHCIAVGGSLQVLEGLAEDSGGTYVKFP